MQISGMDALQAEAARLVSGLSPHRTGATVLALSGELGAGKTTFAQGVARAFGVTEPVTSPTFVIERVYALTQGPFARLVHIDAYRLKGEHELSVLGWDDLLVDTGNIILVEWPEMVAGAIPDTALVIHLSGTGESREITYGKKEN